MVTVLFQPPFTCIIPIMQKQPTYIITYITPSSNYRSTIHELVFQRLIPKHGNSLNTFIIQLEIIRYSTDLLNNLQSIELEIRKNKVFYRQTLIIKDDLEGILLIHNINMKTNKLTLCMAKNINTCSNMNSCIILQNRYSMHNTVIENENLHINIYYDGHWNTILIVKTLNCNLDFIRMELEYPKAYDEIPENYCFINKKFKS